MVKPDLNTWLAYIRKVHKDLIDYSLERIKIVAERLDVLTFTVPIITITGTNGKGSTVSALEAILIASNHRVASFTSPFLVNFNEQIRLNGQAVTDTALIEAFAKIEAARIEVSLSEFEFTTLAALLIFKSADIDTILLEVGLGGANDAVNIINADLTIITSLALDHEEFLGASIDLIAASEARLLRPNKKVLLGVKNAPTTLTEYAKTINCEIYRLAQDFGFTENNDHWHFWNSTRKFDKLAKPVTLYKNAALAIEALLLLDFKFSPQQLHQALKHIHLLGRLQYVPGKPALIFDVAHNIEAVTELAKFLKKHKPQEGRVIAVFSMFKDKKISTTISLLKEAVDLWSIGIIDHPRAASRTQLTIAFQEAGVDDAKFLMNETLHQALTAAKSQAEPEDSILIFGSFHVVRAGLLFFE